MRTADPETSGEVPGSVAPWKPAVPAWRVVLSRELSELWIGGKGLYLILAFSVLLAIETFVLATNAELNLFTPRDMVYEITKIAIQVSMLIGLIIGADSISGERERRTLEGLLLTPAGRSHLVLGKFLAGLTAWPVALVLTVPFMVLLSQGSGAIPRAVLGGALVGVLLIPAFVALGVFVSFWCSSNKTSYFISLGIFLVFVLQGRQWLNPIPVAFDFLSKLVVGHADGVVVEGGEGLTPLPFNEIWRSLVSPIVFTLITLVVLFLYVGRNLTLEAGMRSRGLARVARFGGLTAMAVVMVLSNAALASAYASPQSGDLRMTISRDHVAGRTGDSVEFKTVLTNTGAEASAPLIVAMNIINLSKSGDVVDPEDWSPERTQYVDGLAPGKSVTLPWTVEAVLDGNYMVYLVGIPQPAGPGSSSAVVASPGLHLTIGAFSNLNPSGVLPYTLGVPLAVLAIIVLMMLLRRRRVDSGAAKAESEAPA
jgi:ABC-type transport system involved in cytochrome c biogenesis permease component